MDPVRADRLGVKAADVEVVCFSDRFHGKWVARVMDDREHVLTESYDVFKVLYWRSNLIGLQT